MTCPNCAAANPPAPRFCQQCGSAFGAACPRCGSATWPDARYCTECGAGVAAAPTGAGARGQGMGVGDRGVAGAGAPTGPGVGGQGLGVGDRGVAGAAAPTVVGYGALDALPEERRLVTVLFADVVGFTPLSERLDPEDVRDLMLHTFRALARCVREYGGRVEKYIGDALFGLFGAPVAREDDVERALRCALALHDAARRLLGDDVAPSVLELVLERAEGNPLYLEEVARSLVEAGALVRTESGWHLGEGGERSLPTTLHATLLARLDRLAEPTRHLLQAASVLGRQFALPVLERLVGAAADVDAGLLEAQRASLIEAIDGTATERRYQFRHGLLQEVSYGTLLLRRRRELHRAAAEALLAAAPTPEAAPVEALAEHYAYAEAWPEAQAAAEAAATRAEQSYAYREAASQWHAARRAATARADAVSPHERGRLGEHEGDALLHLGEWTAAQAAYEAALAAWMEEPPGAHQAARGRLHVRLARLAHHQGDPEAISRLLGVAVPGLDPSNPLLSVALSLEAQAGILRGSYHAAAVNARRALALALRVGGPHEQSEAYAALTNPALLGEIGPRTRAYSAEWVRLARAQGDPSELVRALAARVASHLMLRGVAGAAEEADAAEALAVATDLRAPALIRATHAILGSALVFRGDWDGAARALADAMGTRPEDAGVIADVTRFVLGSLHTRRGAVAIGRGWYEEGLTRLRFGHTAIWMGAGLAMNLRVAGDAAGAGAALARAAALQQEIQCPACSLVFYTLAAEGYAALGETAAAAATAAAAQRLGRANGHLPARLAAHRALARLHLDASRPAAALAELTPALRLCQGLENVYERARTEHLAAQARLARGSRRDRAVARDLLGRALRAFEHLGATPEADACRTALAPLPPASRPRRLAAPRPPPLVRAV